MKAQGIRTDALSLWYTKFQALHQVGVTLMVSTHSAEAFAGVNHRTVDLREGAVAA